MATLFRTDSATSYNHGSTLQTTMLTAARRRRSCGQTLICCFIQRVERNYIFIKYIYRLTFYLVHLGKVMVLYENISPDYPYEHKSKFEMNLFRQTTQTTLTILGPRLSFRVFI
jgi:hypothetical protein